MVLTLILHEVKSDFLEGLILFHVHCAYNILRDNACVDTFYHSNYVLKLYVKGLDGDLHVLYYYKILIINV